MEQNWNEWDDRERKLFLEFGTLFRSFLQHLKLLLLFYFEVCVAVNVWFASCVGVYDFVSIVFCLFRSFYQLCSKMSQEFYYQNRFINIEIYTQKPSDRARFCCLNSSLFVVPSLCINSGTNFVFVIWVNDSAIKIRWLKICHNKCLHCWGVSTSSFGWDRLSCYTLDYVN